MSEALSRELAEARFARLYSDHAREIMGYASRRGPVAEDAADVVAETFLVAWRRLGEVPDGPEARLWLYGTARLVLANQRRGERRRTRLAERLREALQERAATHAPGRRPELLRALYRLGGSDRELLMLVGWEELTPSQAARVMEISPIVARTRLHRARRRLRALLAEEAEAWPEANELEIEEAR